jgi:hypothetical protein
LKTRKRNQSDGIRTSIPMSALIKNSRSVVGGLVHSGLNKPMI